VAREADLADEPTWPPALDETPLLQEAFDALLMPVGLIYSEEFTFPTGAALEGPFMAQKVFHVVWQLRNTVGNGPIIKSP
jgi:hypothetical protein